jgi:hypothetical protein
MTTYCLICAPNVIPDDAMFSLGKSCPNCGMNQDMLQSAVTLVHVPDFEPMDDSDQDNSLAWTEYFDAEPLDYDYEDGYDDSDEDDYRDDGPIYAYDYL